MRAVLHLGFLLMTGLGLLATAILFSSHWSFYPNPPGTRRAFITGIKPADNPTMDRTPHGTPMVFVPGGRFLVGSPAGVGLEDEHPQRQARVLPFWLDQHEVTCRQYAAFLNAAQVNEQWRRSYIFARGEQRPGPDKACLEFADGSWRPVRGTEELPLFWVSSFGARAFCEYYGLRLPSEVEFEAAARTFLSIDSNGIPALPVLETANLKNSPVRKQLREIRPKPNQTAPLDLIGNVSEFVSDTYTPDAWSRLDSENPQPVAHGIHAVIKGASLVDSPGSVRIGRRVFSHALQCRFEYVGFRCAADAR